MDMVFMSGKMEIAMKVNGDIVCDMVKVQIYLQMETFTLENMFMGLPKAMDNINGVTAIFIVDSLKMGRNRAKGYGRNLLETKILIATRVSIWMI